MNSRTRFKKWAIRGLALGLSLLVATTALVAESRGLPASAAASSPVWQMVPTPDSASTQNNVLNAVSCVSVSGCTAVGEHWNGTNFQTLAQSDESSNSWSITPSENIGPYLKEDNFLNGLACVQEEFDQSSCVAVGSYFDSGTGAFQTLVETWQSGYTWTVMQSADVGSSEDNVLNGVFCTSLGSLGPLECDAVGEYTSGGSEHPLIENMQNSVWTVVSSPGSGELKSVACTGDTSSNCMAVGDDGGTSTLAEQWNGTSWSVLTSPNPSNASDIALNSVSCTSSSVCTAVGDYSTGIGQAGLIEAWDGTSWSIVTSPSPPKASDVVLNSVSCFELEFSQGSECTAAGDYSTGGNELTLAENWDGTSWSVVQSPNVDPLTNNSLNGVSCLALTECAAVGDYSNGHNDQTLGMTLVEPPVASYSLGASDGGVFTFNFPYHGSMGGKPLNAPMVGVATDPSFGGYWLVASDGGVFSFNVKYHGSMGGKPLKAPVVGMAEDPLTDGYWLVAADGGVFSFDTPYLGSMGGKPLDAPIVGMARDAATGGYWLVASDGGVFSFDAPYLGSMGGKALNAPIVGMASDPTTGGYWLVASDGGVFSFGARYDGSMGGKHLNAPIVGMTVDPATGGYWLAASDGGVFSFDAPYFGSMGGKHLNAPIVGVS